MTGKADIYWFCGLSGAGKSTIAQAAAERLIANGWSVLVLDGDEVRDRIHQTLGFSHDDIVENNRRIAEICIAERNNFDVILVPVIAPIHGARLSARNLLSPSFWLVWCNADVAIAAARDVKGLYAMADRGEINDLIGYSPDAVPFEPPDDADIVLKTGQDDAALSVAEFCTRIESARAAKAEVAIDQ